MNYFTPDSIERFGSDDEATARAAHDELERHSDAYARHLAAIQAELPPRLRELLERFYLHDARLLAADGDDWLTADRLTAADAPSTGVLRVALQLDPPPHEVLVLAYRDAVVEVVRHGPTTDEACPAVEWLYDEIEIGSADAPAYRHAILFTGNVELRLRFRDFDFFALAPVAPSVRQMGRSKLVAS